MKQLEDCKTIHKVSCRWQVVELTWDGIEAGGGKAHAMIPWPTVLVCSSTMMIKAKALELLSGSM